MPPFSVLGYVALTKTAIFVPITMKPRRDCSTTSTLKSKVSPRGVETMKSNIGAILQEVVDKVEEEIPEYENETMETTVCPLPIVELATRLLDKSNREVQKTGGRYIYRGGGKCRRCRQNNNDRRFLQSVEAACLNTDTALFGANLTDLAETAVEAVSDAFLNLKEIALECPNLKSGKILVIWVIEILKECKAAMIRARNAVKKARDQRQQAEQKQSTSPAYEKLQRRLTP
jgi:TusA-related sulfurtransferase